MTAGERRAVQYGHGRAQLWVRIADPRALNLYRNRGYDPTGDEKIDGNETILRLEKDAEIRRSLKARCSITFRSQLAI